MIHLALFELEAGAQRDFDPWYEREHVPRMLEKPGWLRMRRYRCTDGRPLLASATRTAAR
jgi:hypothetical protein